MNWRNGQFGIKGPVVNMPVDTDEMLKQLPRGLADDKCIVVNIKRRMFAKTTYLSNMVSRNVLGPWVEVLRVSPLYENCGRNIDEGRLERLYREAVAPDEDFNVKACPELADLGPADDDEAGLKQYCFLKNTHDALYSALDNTACQSFAELFQHHGIRDFDEYEEVIRSGLARPTQLLKRDMYQTNVNPFNSLIASVLKSNINLQVILDVYACASYVVEYGNKSNRGVSNLGRTIKYLIEQDPSAQQSFESAMRQLGVNILNAIAMSAQESAWFSCALTCVLLAEI
ncbi:hypothetical protein MRX96_025722 [Rhipicephalus microplus]